MIINELLNAHGLFLYVINTGEFYQANCERARGNASAQEWQQFLRLEALPRYRRETHTTFAILADEVMRAADSLKDYYERHLEEARLLPAGTRLG